MAALRWDQRNLACGGAALGIGLLCGLPLLWIVLEAGRGSVDLWRPEAWAVDVFAWSVFLALSAAVLATLLATCSALLLDRLPSRLRHAFLLALCFPLFLPSYLHALAWSSLLAENGWVGALLQIEPSKLPNAWWLSAWVLTTSYCPVAILTVFAALRRWDVRYEWSGWAHGRDRKALAALKFRYLQSPVCAAGLIIFLLVFADFAVPDFFQVRTYSTDVFVQVSSYLDPSFASVLSLPVMITAVVCFAALARVVARATMTSGSRPHTDFDRHEAPRPWHAAAAALFAVVAMLVALPLANLVRQTASFETFVAALRMIWSDAVSGAVIAAMCASLAVALSIFGAYAYDRRVRPAGLWLRLLPAATFALPASLLGLASIALWNRPNPLGWFYEAGVALVLAITARWLPVTFEVLAQGLRQAGRGPEEAGLATGRSWSSVFAVVLLPALYPAIAVAFLLTFVLAFNELTLVTLLAPAGVSTLPLRVFQTVHYGPQALLAAISVWQILFLLVPLGLLSAAALRWAGARRTS